MLGDGFDHEIRTVADVGRRAKKYRADADGQDLSCAWKAVCDVFRAGHAVKRAQEAKIRRRVVQHGGQRARAPEKNPGEGFGPSNSFACRPSQSSAGIIVEKIPANKMATS